MVPSCRWFKSIPAHHFLWAVDGGRDRSLLKAGSLPVRSTNSIRFAEMLERIHTFASKLRETEQSPG